MSGFNPYNVIIRPVGRFTSEKVLNAAERMDAGQLDEFRKAGRLELVAKRKEIRAYATLSDLSGDDREKAVKRRLLAAKRVMTPEEFKKAKKSLEEDETFSKADKARMIKAFTATELKHRRPERRGQNTNQNKVVFIVRNTATKPEIRRAIEEVYAVKVIRVNTLHTRRGKRAIIKLSAKDNAEDIYTRLGQM
jgi:large subunit ribosomal protein L23